MDSNKARIQEKKTYTHKNIDPEINIIYTMCINQTTSKTT